MIIPWQHWHTHVSSEPDNAIHVWPCNDLMDHDVSLYSGGSCVCGPAVEVRPDGVMMVTHHSLDGREKAE